MGYIFLMGSRTVKEGHRMPIANSLYFRVSTGSIATRYPNLFPEKFSYFPSQEPNVNSDNEGSHFDKSQTSCNEHSNTAETAERTEERISHLFEVEFPPEWDSQKTNCLVVPIATQTLEYSRIAKLIKLSLNDKAIISIKRIQNIH